MSTQTVSGHCLCRGIELTATVSSHLDACHCEMCRRWSGGPFLGLKAGQSMRIGDQQSLLSVFGSSEWAERGFCSRCGTHLFYRLKASGEAFVPVGMMSLSDPVSMTQQIFVDEQPEYYAFANDTERLTGEQVMAAFASDPSGD